MKKVILINQDGKIVNLFEVKDLTNEEVARFTTIAEKNQKELAEKEASEKNILEMKIMALVKEIENLYSRIDLLTKEIKILKGEDEDEESIED